MSIRKVRECAARRPSQRSGRTDAVRQFLTANPDEELTYEIVTSKWGCTRDGAREIVRNLKAQGFPVESLHVIRLRAKGIAA